MVQSVATGPSTARASARPAAGPYGRWLCGGLWLVVLAGLAAGPALARPDGDDGGAGAAAVIVHCKDGRVLKGELVRETPTEITLRMAFGEVPIARDEIARIERKEKPAASPGPGAPEPGLPSDAGPARRVDDALELELTLPGPAWSFVDPPTAPGVRLEAERREPAMVCQVLVEELPPPDRRADTRAVKEAMTKTLRRRYRAVRDLTVRPARRAGLSGWQLSYEVDTRLITTRYHLEELRVQRSGYQIVVRVVVPRPGRAPISATAAAEARRAIEGFAFSAAIGREGASYHDRRYGLRVDLPPGWVVLPKLLDDARPIRFLPPSGRGLYRLERDFAKGMATAEAWADRFVDRQRQADARFRLTTRAAASVGGLPAVDLRYVGTVPGRPAETAATRRLVWVDRDHVLALCSYAPPGQGDPAAGALFRGVGQVDPPRVGRLLMVASRERNAIALARKRQDERDGVGALAALEAGLPKKVAFVEALAIRGLAHAASGDLRAAIRDLEEAVSRRADPAVSRALAKLESRRAKAVAEKDWKRAKRLYRQAIEHDPENRSYRSDLVTATVARSRSLTRSGEHEQAVRVAQAAVRADPEEPRYRRQLVRAYQDWIRALLRSKTNRDLYKARNLAKKALRLDPKSSSIRSLAERVDAVLKRRERR